MKASYPVAFLHGVVTAQLYKSKEREKVLQLACDTLDATYDARGKIYKWFNVKPSEQGFMARDDAFDRLYNRQHTTQLFENMLHTLSNKNMLDPVWLDSNEITFLNL